MDGNKLCYLQRHSKLLFSQPIQSGSARPNGREKVSRNGQAFIGACTAGSDGYNQVKLHVAKTLHMITYPQYMGLVQDILI
jgi:hypothetical protein